MQAVFYESHDRVSDDTRDCFDLFWVRSSIAQAERAILRDLRVSNGWKADVSLCIGPFTLGLDKKAAFIGKMSVGGARPRQTGGRMEAT